MKKSRLEQEYEPEQKNKKWKYESVEDKIKSKGALLKKSVVKVGMEFLQQIV